MSIQKLNAENAIIKTATVEVKTLTISGKQVTLAVFRQLREESIFDPVTCQMHGVAWGQVNYHPDKCADGAEHLHVVWQRGDQLRRYIIYKNPIIEFWVHLKQFTSETHEHAGNLNMLLAGWQLWSFKETGAMAFDVTSTSPPHYRVESLAGKGSGWTVRFDQKLICDDFEQQQIWAALMNTWVLQSSPQGEGLRTIADGDNLKVEFSTRESQEENARKMRDSVQAILDASAMSELVEHYLSTDQQETAYSLDLFASACSKALRLKQAAEDHKREWTEAYDSIYRNLGALDQLFIAV